MFSDASETVRGRQIECKENGAILSKQEGEDQRKCVCVHVCEGKREKMGVMGRCPFPSAMQNEKIITSIKSNMKLLCLFVFFCSRLKQ